jgi:hypothetical protein
MQVELFHELSAVGFNGFYADIEVGGDLFCGPPFGNELQYLSFPGA